MTVSDQQLQEWLHAKEDPAAIADFRKRWREESGNDAPVIASPEQLLEDADLRPA